MKNIRLNWYVLGMGLFILSIVSCNEDHELIIDKNATVDEIPEVSERLNLFVLGDLAIFPNHDTIFFSLELEDELTIDCVHRPGRAKYLIMLE